MAKSMPSAYRHTLVLSGLLLLAGTAAILWQGVLFAAVIALAGFLWLLSHRLDLGWYVLVFLAPMMHWTIRLDHYPYLFRGFPSLLQVYAPVVEFWTVGLIIAWMIAKLRAWRQKGTVHIAAPGWRWYGLFVLSAAVSLFSLGPGFSSGVWYIGRFLIFVYAGYVVLGADIIENKKILERSLVAFAASGAVAAIMGVASLVCGAWRDVYGIVRVTPFALGGWAPFGDQHIFLAEAILATLPSAGYLWHLRYRDKDSRQWLSALIAVMIAVALLTLSRAGWIALAVEAAVAAHFAGGKKMWRYYLGRVWPLALAVLPILFYFVYFLSGSDIVRGSNATRWSLTQISWMYFQEHPLIGTGIGSFVPLVADTWYFTLEFGDPVDAHGIVQKIGTEQGILGLVTFALFVWLLLRRVYLRATDLSYDDSARAAAVFGLALMCGSLTFQLFNTQYYSSVMWVPLALALAAQSVHRRDTRVVGFLAPPLARARLVADV